MNLSQSLPKDEINETAAGLANAYANAPVLHPNLLLGSLQLIFWLFFHPSAWRNHIARLDASLRPGFSLTNLKRSQWQNPALRRLLLLGYGILPCLAGLAAALALALLGVSITSIILGTLVGVIFAVGVGITSSLIMGVAVSMAAGLAVGAVGGVGVGLGLELGVGLIRTRGTAFDVVISAAIFGAAFGLFFGMSGNLIREMARAERAYTLSRQILGLIAGILLSGGILFSGGYSLISGGVHLLVISAAAGLAIGLTVSWARDLIAGVLMAITAILGLYVASIIPGSSGLDIALFGALLIPPYLLAERIAGPWLSAIACAFGGGVGWIGAIIAASREIPLLPYFPLSVFSILFGLTLFFWRPLVFYPFVIIWNSLLRYIDRRCPGNQPSLLRGNSAFWDEHQPLPLIGLAEHLLMVMERNPDEGQAALDYLAASRQRWAAQAVQIELDARELEACLDIEAIGQAHRSLAAGELAGSVSALLRSFSRLSQDVMAALEQSSAYNQRLALSMVEDRLDGLLRELTRSSERYALRFRPIAAHWRQIIAIHVRGLAEMVEIRQEIDSPYVIGVPLTAQQEIFVGRTNISARIEQLLRDRHRPPLLLYGQRRMGKTSLLNNLSRLLPSTIIPLFVDLQGPASQANDYTAFFYNIARGMINSARRQRNLSLPPLSREMLQDDPFTRFDEWLDEVEEKMGDHTALVTLDEFEALEAAIDKGRLDGADLLSMLRHFIQHRPRFKVLLTSSQTLAEFQRWSSYLINVQVIHLSYLSDAEAYQLIERPVKDFPLRYEPEASRRVLHLTRGHPFLVQLLCDEIVAFKNEQDPAVRRLATLADVEAVTPEALNRGSFFFADIERNQIDQSGLALLRHIARQGEGAIVRQAALAGQFQQPDQLRRDLALLIRRELIEEVEERDGIDGGYRFQVELIRRWFVR